MLVAFGATRKAGVDVAADPQVQALLDAETPVVCVVAKSDIRHVERALRTTGEENLAMVRDTVAHLVANGRRVFVDCEHFFDGFRYDPAYTASVVSAALEAGAERVVMCDTNGGMLPSHDHRGDQRRRRAHRGRAPTGSASTARTTPPARWPTRSPPSRPGVDHFQCTANGYGERPGNADLFAVVGNLQLKLGLHVLPDGCLEKAVRVSTPSPRSPTSPPTPTRPTSGPRPSLTRRGCTRARSRWIRCSTTTSTRRSSATTCGSW